jgi:TPR repeat protein
MPKTQVHRNDPAVAALVQAAESGAAEAAQALGDSYREGKDVEQSDALALHWYAVGARLGDAQAQNNLGSMLLNGIGCEREAEGAVHWYRASAEQGNAVAQFNLGLRYLHGDGVEQDDRTAGYWIGKAAVQGYIDAVGELGTLFRFGRGTAPDLLQAAQLHMEAAEEGDATSHGNLSDYRGELIDLALAGNREAAFDLSLMYHRGLGGETDQPLCWAWIKWAHKGCRAMPEGAARIDELDATVEDAYTFFRAVTDTQTRRQGEALFRTLRADRRPPAAGSSRRRSQVQR